MMKLLPFSSLCSFFFGFCLQSVLSEQVAASVPPRGWNSYDSFCWTISEEEFLQNAQLVSQRLHQHGYEYVVVDYLWYRRKVPGAYVDSLGFDVIDEWGRMIPDPVRWPSSKNGNGFTEVAKKVHAMGLKFGIHIMRGISTQAFNANTPILDITTGKAYEESGRQWHAKDIGVKERSCAWMSNGFMSVNTKLGAAKAFLRSLHQQYADWGIDFVKHDCIFGDDLDFGEISTVSEILNKLNRPIIYSLSPGTSASPAMAKGVSGLVNMYRITGDDWDTWADVASHFNVTRDFAAANYIGAQGLNGKSWPDLDMLPLGWLTDPGSNEGPHRNSNLNLDEKRTQMTLWSIAKSPLMFGGDMRNLDETTYDIITNPTLMEINYYSSKNMEFPLITSSDKFVQKNRGLNFKLRSLKESGKSESVALGFSSCHSEDAKGWSVKSVDDNNLEQICWKEESRRKHQQPFCLYKRESHLATDEAIMYKQKFQGKLHLLATGRMEFCLGGSPRKKLTSKELKRGSFSPCKLDTNQMWELKNNGTLVNSYSGLCASMYTTNANSNSGGIRSWIAEGRKGEIYVAFFNLNAEKKQISTKISDVSSALRTKKVKPDHGSCSVQEVWSGNNLGVIKDVLTAPVETHGCALFVLQCD